MEDVTNLLGKRNRNDSLSEECEKRPKVVAFTLDQLKEAGKQQYPDLSFVSCTNEHGDSVLKCSRRDLHSHPPLGLISRVQVVVNQDGTYDFQVVMFNKEKGSITTIDEYLALCNQIASKNGYKFCPGIDPDTYKTIYHDVIRYDPTNLRRTMHPVRRIDSCKCILWHKLAKNASIFEKDMDAVMCPACKRLCNELNQRLKKVKSTNLQQKENRLQPFSHFPEKYLSPKKPEEEATKHATGVIKAAQEILTCGS